MVERVTPGSARAAQLLGQAMKAARVGGKGLQGAAVGGLRVLMPLIEVYSGQRLEQQEGGDRKGAYGLKVSEERVLKAGTQKAFLELVEIASHTHPVYADAPRFKAYGADGAAQTPGLVHLLALAAAARQLIGDDKGEQGEGEGSSEGEGGRRTADS